MPPLYRADHVGSLLRPQSLLDARKAITKDLSSTYNLQTANSNLAAIEQSAIEEVIKAQLIHSVRPLTNGEYPRPIFYAGFFELLNGMTTAPALPIPEAFRTNFPTTTKLAAQFNLKTRSSVQATSKISFPTSSEIPYLQEWLQLRSALPSEHYWPQAKLTIPAPNYQHIQLRPGTAWTAESGYTDDESYFRDLAAAYTQTITTLYAHGCRNIQIDDPHLTYFCDEAFLAGCAHDGTDTDALLDLYLRVYSWIFEPIRAAGTYADLRVGMHLCRGNMVDGTRWVSGSYERIARKLFEIEGVETFYLEFDDALHAGGFEPLRFLPRDGKGVVLGLVSTKKGELEDKNELVSKVWEAAGVIAQAWGVEAEVALEVLAVSPQCGFSSHALGKGVGMDWDGMWRKLGLCREVAEEIWGKDVVAF